jgi:hypothetical protein
MKVKILGYTYPVIFSPPAEVGGMTEAGRMNPMKQIILIDPTASMQARESTLIHEIIEALNYHLELGLEHKTVMQLETALYAVLKDNPNLFKDI